MELIIAGVAFVVGLIAGRFLAPHSGRIKELEKSIEASEQQHQAYKDSVAEHFSGSAHLFGDITEKYRSLYQHMSAGAYNLCDRRNIPRELSTSHVNILAVESPEVSPELTNKGIPIPPESSSLENKPAEEMIVDVTRSGLSPLDPESQQLAMKNKKDSGDTAEIIDLDSQRNEDEAETQQAKDYAIKAKGVINHNSLNQDDVST